MFLDGLECHARSVTQVPPLMEIGLVERTSEPSQYPGLFLFTLPGRFIRPVKNLIHDTIEMIGSFEQVYMDICVDSKEAIPGVSASASGLQDQSLGSPIHGPYS